MATRSIRLDDDLNARLVSLAAKEDRSVNWCIVRAVSAYVAHDGLIYTQPQPADLMTLTDEGREALQADRVHHPARQRRPAKPDPK